MALRSKEAELQGLFSAFPGGRPGAGLLLLRTVLGITAGLQGTFYFAGGSSSPGHLTLGIVLIASGFCILIGFLTPATGGLTALVFAGMAMAWVPLPQTGVIDSGVTAILTACVAVSLVFLGPGALSLDARLFGRREIIIPPVPRS